MSRRALRHGDGSQSRPRAPVVAERVWGWGWPERQPKLVVHPSVVFSNRKWQLTDLAQTALGWHSTPLAQRSPTRRASLSDSIALDITLPSFISSETTSGARSSSLPPAGYSPLQENGAIGTLFPDLKDFLVPLNDVSEDVSAGQLQETLPIQVNLNQKEGLYSEYDAEDGSVELARGSGVPLDDRDSAISHFSPLDDHQALQDAPLVDVAMSWDAHVSPLEAVNESSGDERTVDMRHEQGETLVIRALLQLHHT